MRLFAGMSPVPQIIANAAVEDALKIAAYAIKPDGGFGSVEVIPQETPSSDSTTFNDWLFNC